MHDSSYTTHLTRLDLDDYWPNILGPGKGGNLEGILKKPVGHLWPCVQHVPSLVERG